MHEARIVDTDLCHHAFQLMLTGELAPNRSECRVIVLRGQPLEVDETLVYLMKRL
jgi:hypothetical protein